MHPRHKIIVLLAERHINLLMDQLTYEFSKDIEIISMNRDIYKRKSEYSVILSKPYKELEKFVRAYVREKRKAGIKNRHVIGEMYRFEFSAWELEFINRTRY